MASNRLMPRHGVVLPVVLWPWQIRFGHTTPVPHHVDVEITQPAAVGPAITYTWTNFKFGMFSDVSRTDHLSTVFVRQHCHRGCFPCTFNVGRCM